MNDLIDLSIVGHAFAAGLIVLSTHVPLGQEVLIGIYLVFASLIIPALATTGLRRGNRLLLGYFIGAIAYLVGIVISFYMDLPTGAVIVWSMAFIAIVVGFLVSDKGTED